MSLSSSPSPLPKLPFLIADAAFLAAAWFIADSARHPLGSTAVAGIVICAIGAAVCGAIPFILDYSRRQEAALDERQRSLEGIARTVATAAEQIGIAAGGLHEIVEIAQRNLREAEKLPKVLAEQVAELEAKFNASRDEDREQLESELATLRASESERLEATAQKIARAATDWAKAESFGLRHVVAAKTFIAELEQKTATLKAVLAAAPLPSAPLIPPQSTGRGVRGFFSTGIPPAYRARSEKAPNEPVSPQAPEPPIAAEPPSVEPAQAEALAVAEPPARYGSAVTDSPPESAPSENAPAPPTEAESAPSVQEAPPAPPIPGPEAEAEAEAEAPPEPPLAPKPKRVAKKAYDPQESIPGLDLPEETPAEATPAPSASADGATRLVVTSYIGIGNRLFIRGEGPGLSWAEGVPLQFVSIGKWRWETANATAPVRFKLFKNDRDECAALSTDVLEPGHQQELMAKF